MAKRNGQRLIRLLEEIRGCTACAAELPLGPRPVLQAHSVAPILIVGQAPGTRVHETGIPFNDPSGDRLRDWLGLERAQFYDPRLVSLVPMAFCYPGRGRGGDLPPPSRCAELWRQRLLAELKQVRLTLVIGQYAQRWHLPERAGERLTDVVADWRRYAPTLFPTPHPSPRNTLWLRRNAWFEAEVIPALQLAVRDVLSDTPPR
ncbi:MAG: uracil-DNA glycosylase family protein [Pseudomonadota bacterium]